MQSLSAGDLHIQVAEETPADPIRLHWLGKSNDRQPARVITPFVSDVFSVAGERGVAVEMHFERLEHFNSSTIAALIQVIQDARARNVRLVVVYDQGLKWQKLSFDALRVFAKDDLLQLRST